MNDNNSAQGPSFDAFDGPLLQDPYPFFAQWIDESPVFYAEEIGYWVITRYEDCRRALKDYPVFSASNTLDPLFPPCPAAGKALADGGFRSIPTMTNVDPPAHTRTRRIAHQAFTPRRVRAMEDVVRGIVRPFLGDRVAGTTSDFVADVAWALPAHVIFSILGLSPSEVAEVKAGSSTRLAFMFGQAEEDEQVETAKGMAEFWLYCEDLANDRRSNPRDDFTTDLVTRPDADGNPLTQQEVSAILFGLLLAGHETTTSLLTNGLRRLLENRESWEAICADPSLIPNAVEEILRFDSSVVHWRRKTTQPVAVCGVEIPADAN
ncbi:MAG: cytochrome P450, partial [Actinobacteria bacterium]|nr:cytochrome P450 [Actinomycetota bacterium]